eukprot:132379-Chlamydomonas_euryale.AAC.1
MPKCGCVPCAQVRLRVPCPSVAVRSMRRCDCVPCARSSPIQLVLNRATEQAAAFQRGRLRLHVPRSPVQMFAAEAHLG